MILHLSKANQKAAAKARANVNLARAIPENGKRRFREHNRPRSEGFADALQFDAIGCTLDFARTASDVLYSIVFNIFNTLLPDSCNRHEAVYLNNFLIPFSVLLDCLTVPSERIVSVWVLVY